MSSSSKKALAKELFIHSGTPQKEIADLLGVTENTVSRWKKEGKWESLKVAGTITREQLIATQYKLLEELQNKIRSREPGNRSPTPAEADTMAKMATSIERLSGKENLPDFIRVFQFFGNWLKTRDLDACKSFIDYQHQFLLERFSELR